MSAAIGQVVSFADRGATLALPAGYSYALEDKGRTIVVRPPKRGSFEFRLTFNSLAQLAGTRPTIAQEFIADAAKKDGRTLGRIRGTDSFGFFEAAGGSMVNGEPARNMSGLITLGQGYVTLALTIPEKNVDTPAVRDFLGGGMEALLGGLRSGKSRKLPGKDARKTTRAPNDER
jgi:hypothetical protein